MSWSVTPACAATAGSTLRGTPRSITSSGPCHPGEVRRARHVGLGRHGGQTPRRRRPARRPRRRGRAARISKGPPAASRTRSRARAAERLATTTTRRGASPGAMSERARHTPRPISPAPTTTTRASRRPPSSSPRATVDGGVGERGRALADRRSRCAPACPSAARGGTARRAPGPDVPSSCARSKARRTWPTTSVSPVTTDSRPEVTENRWLVTSSSKRMVAWAESSSTERARVLGEHVEDLGHGVVEAVDHPVDLGAQAGREERPPPARCGGGSARCSTLCRSASATAVASSSGSGACVCWSPMTTTDTRFLPGSARNCAGRVASLPDVGHAWCSDCPARARWRLRWRRQASSGPWDRPTERDEGPPLVGRGPGARAPPRGPGRSRGPAARWRGRRSGGGPLGGTVEDPRVRS